MLLCMQKKNKYQIYIMKAVKMISLALIIIGAALLVLSYFQGWVNDNGIIVYSFVAMIAGLVGYIISGRKCLEKI